MRTPARTGIAVVLGTRPEMVKLAGIIAELGEQARVFHTGQHYDPALSGDVWSSLGLPEPEAVLDVGGATRAVQVASALHQLDVHFAERPPRAVVVQGDTNATLAGALAANAHDIPLIHVEAGLRSFDRAMPEEHNRVMVDHLSDLLCAPTSTNVANLRAENVAAGRVLLTGNTVVEAVDAQRLDDRAAAAVLDAHGLTPNRYVLATFHRPENTDPLDVLTTILEELAKIDAEVVAPLHPRTRSRIEKAGLSHLLAPLTVIDPVPPAEFLALAGNAAVLVSDSGGVQEECSVLKRPLLVVRASTERPEVIGTFAERTNPGPEISLIVNEWLDGLTAKHAELARTPSPYGDGSASARIATAIHSLLARQAEQHLSVR